jgi:hypothetical protein
MVDDETRDCDCWAHKQKDAPTRPPEGPCGCPGEERYRKALEMIASRSVADPVAWVNTRDAATVRDALLMGITQARHALSGDA